VGDIDGYILEISLPELLPASDTGATVVNNGSFNLPAYPLSAPEKDRIRSSVVMDPTIDYSRVSFFYKLPAAENINTRAAYREHIIDELIKLMMRARFDEKLAVQNSSPEQTPLQLPYTNIDATLISYVKPSRHYAVSAMAKTSMVVDCIEDILAEKEQLLRYGFLEAELYQAKRTLLATVERRAVDSVSQTPELSPPSAYYTEAIVNCFVRNEVFLDDVGAAQLADILLANIALKDVNTALSNYYQYNDMLIFIEANETERITLPAHSEILDFITQSKKKKPAAQQARVATSEAGE
jgi:hypothetical protein